MPQYLAGAATIALTVGLRILGALVLWIVGRFAIKRIVAAVQRRMTRQHVDPTLIRYLGSAFVGSLNVLLVIATLGVFGVQTTTFAGVLAAAGVAIGLAWSGLLSNFAAGIFMMVLHPFKSGDFVTVGGVTGTVHEIGLFATSIDTPDNVRTFVGNGKVFSDTIQNFSTNPHRRVDLAAQLAHGSDLEAARRLLRARVATIPHVLAEPAPVIELLEFTLAGPVLTVRPSCSNEHYWSVYFATNLAIREELGNAGFPVPEHHNHLRITGPAATAMIAPVALARPA